MRIGYFDCFSGAAGDMILAALIHAGYPVAALCDVVQRLGLSGVTVSAEPTSRAGLAATHVRVDVDTARQPEHRHLPQITKLILDADLPATATETALSIFQRLAEAEAEAHGIPINQVHFHEVGAADAIVDVVGACVGTAALGLERIICSPIPTGHGTVTCTHGVLPVPAPATANLLRGVPLATCDEPGELTTPTGAAILTTLAESYGAPPPMRLISIGYGAGTREGRTRANVLRLMIGEAEEPDRERQDRVTVLETQVDDVTGQAAAYAVAQLLAAGALDAYIVPIIMKKGRPGQLLTVLCQPEDVGRMEAVLFAETTTLGVRRQEVLRDKLARGQTTVQTRFGPIRLKLGLRDGKAVQAWPEYEDCVTAATRTGVPLRTVQQEALQAWTQRSDGRHGRDPNSSRQ